MAKKIKIYTTPICPQCERAKDFFKKKDLKYETVDLSKNEKTAEKVFEKAGKKIAPIIEIGNEMIVGFNRSKIEKALEK